MTVVGRLPGEDAAIGVMASEVNRGCARCKRCTVSLITVGRGARHGQQVFLFDWFKLYRTIRCPRERRGLD